MSKVKLVAGLLLMMPALVLGAGHEKMAKYPVGKLKCNITINKTEVGFIVGVGGGHGMLQCEDMGSHKFRVGGFQIGSLGLAGATMTGRVYGLNKLSDFNGTYNRGEASISAIAGKGTMTLKNQNGVYMTLSMSTAGAKANLGGGGLRLTLE